MEKFRLILLLTAAVMGCTALLAGCGKGSDSSSKAEEGAKTSDDGSINKDLTATELARLLGNGTNLGNTMEAYGHKSYSADTDPESFETFWGRCLRNSFCGRRLPWCFQGLCRCPEVLQARLR